MCSKLKRKDYRDTFLCDLTLKSHLGIPRWHKIWSDKFYSGFWSHWDPATGLNPLMESSSERTGGRRTEKLATHTWHYLNSQSSQFSCFSSCLSSSAFSGSKFWVISSFWDLSIMPSRTILAKSDPSFLNSEDHHFVWKCILRTENYLPAASSRTDAALGTAAGMFLEDEGKHGLENAEKRDTI